MAARQATDEAEIRQRIDDLAAAVRAMDLEGLRSFYASDIVSFDFEPPLRYVGSATKLGNWGQLFTAYQGPLGYDLHELAITVGDGVAFGHSLNRISGTLRNGHPAASWVRWTACFRKLDGDWVIAHDHVSVPSDVQTGRAALDLRP